MMAATVPALALPEHLRGRAALRPRDLVESFGISKTKVRALIVAGKLDCLKLDGICLLTRESVERWLAQGVLIQAATNKTKARA